MKKSFYSKEESNSSEDSSEPQSSEEKHNECVLIAFKTKYGYEFEDAMIYYEGELISALDELRYARNKM